MILFEANYRVCERCVMDTSALGIDFDDQGWCNFCREFESELERVKARTSYPSLSLQEFVDELKMRGEGKPYDCIVGVSGGVDSSYVLLKAVSLGLRPLAVHMDNGWNSELAQNNIAQLITGLNVDLYTHVIDWEEYRRLMQGFLDSDVIDVELLYDNAMLAVNFQLARRFGVRHILGGTNRATEGMRIPANWNWFKYDKRNIRALGRKAGVRRLKTFPAYGFKEHLKYRVISQIQWTPFLDYIDYRKQQALDELQSAYGFKQYPYKHYESVFTRFYQGHLLPVKFGIDKRRLHWSTLIVSGQATRAVAMDDLGGIAYPSEGELADDVRYFLKKMLWTQEDLDEYLARPEVSHACYPTEKPTWDRVIQVKRRLKPERAPLPRTK